VKPTYYEHCRIDGWPICPSCDEDELYSRLVWTGDGERPPLAAYLAVGLRCYRCGWTNIDPVTDRVIDAGESSSSSSNDVENGTDYETTGIH